MHRVLFVDDDPNILNINRTYFQRRDYEVFTAAREEEALQIVKEHDMDCIVLDVILPAGEDGYHVCRALRELTTAPIVFLTSVSEQQFLYEGFASGGDDFMTKPYDLRELHLRVEAQIRRYRGLPNSSEIISYPPLRLDLTSRTVKIQEQPVSLTGGEFDILACLCTKPNQVFSPSEIYAEVWKMPGLDATHTVQVHMSHLRHKLEAVYPEHKFIQTVWGKGYLFVPKLN